MTATFRPSPVGPLSSTLRSRRLPDGEAFLWWGVWACVVLVWAAGYVQRFVNHDAAWYLWMARAMLDGARLYVDVADTNPPLIVFLSALPVWIAGLLHVSAIAAFEVFVFLLAMGSAITCAWALDRVLDDASPTSRRLLVTAVLFCVLPLVKSDFGQREHFAVMLSLPFVFVAAGSAVNKPVGRRAAFALGVAAGLGLVIKPHLLIAWVLIELALAVTGGRGRRWRWRPETLGVLAALAGYGAVLVLAVPQYLPFAVKATSVYGALLNPGMLSLLRLPENELWAVATVALLLVRLDPDRRRQLVVFLAAGTGLLLGALAQMKGWDYHLYPARVVLGLTLVGCAVSVMDRVADLDRIVRGGARTVALLLAGVLLASSVRYTLQAKRPPSRDLVAPLGEMVRGRGRSMCALQMLLYPGFPVLNYSGMTWAGRYNSLWFLPAFYTADLSTAATAIAPHTLAQMVPLEREFFEQVVDDLTSARPDVLIVQDGVIRGVDVAKPFDLLAYYRQDDRFARLLGEYERLDAVGDFTVYVRRAR